MPKQIAASRPPRKTPKPKPLISRMSPWVRLYTSIRHDPKILVLSHRDRWIYIALLAMAGESKDGTLTNDRAHIAIELRITLPEAEQLLNEFIENGLLDIVGWQGDVPILSPHNWAGRQYKSDNSAERTRAWRERGKHTDDVSTVQPVTSQDRHGDVSALYSVSGSEQDHRPKSCPGRDVGSSRGCARDVNDTDGEEDGI
jgi:hypothetical protein